MSDQRDIFEKGIQNSIHEDEESVMTAETKQPNLEQTQNDAPWKKFLNLDAKIIHPNPVQTHSDAPQKNILDLTSEEARSFLLKKECYCTVDLPNYFEFQSLIDEADAFFLNNPQNLKELSKKSREHEDINYTLLNNKDGKYAWRPFQLIHPVWYVLLVHEITAKKRWNWIKRRFCIFSADPNICCLSIPVVPKVNEKNQATQIRNWWEEIEQRSIELALEYHYILQTDITDCYGAIYTHSIAWALHTKKRAKRKRGNAFKNLIGNYIDNCIQNMRHGQTNGIPQGSTLMDFIAEMVLGYIDRELSKRIKLSGIVKFFILRYRDDYRIFVDNPQDGENIIKLLTEVTISFGLKLNSAKTKVSDDIIRSSIKTDKFAWMNRKNREKNLQKQLLIIYEHSLQFPNAGSLKRVLKDYHERLSYIKSIEYTMPLISIVIEIAYRNPNVYPYCAAVLSNLLDRLKCDEDKKEVFQKIQRKFAKLPNTEYLAIWLQSFSYTIFKDQDIDYNTALCQLVSGKPTNIWNIDWIHNEKLKEIIDVSKIIDRKKLDSRLPVISVEEVDTFHRDY